MFVGRLVVEGGLGIIGIIHIKGLVFGDDFFQLRFDARGILFRGKMNKFFDAPVEPVLITMVSFQDEDLPVGGSDNPLSFGDQLFVKFLSGPKSDLLDFDVQIGFKA